jgi:hypothetical protein
VSSNSPLTRSLETARTTIVGTESITPTPKAFPAGIFTPQSESLADENISSLATEYSGVLLSSSTKIRELKEVASPLAQQDEPMLDPAFFLASVSKGWAPRVVAVYTGPDVAGILYAKERVISSISTGVVYADGSLGGMLLVTSEIVGTLTPSGSWSFPDLSMCSIPPLNTMIHHFGNITHIYPWPTAMTGFSAVWAARRGTTFGIIAAASKPPATGSSIVFRCTNCALRRSRSPPNRNLLRHGDSWKLKTV